MISGAKYGSVRVWEKGRDGGWQTGKTLGNCGKLDDEVLGDGIVHTPDVDQEVCCSKDAKRDILHSFSAIKTYRNPSR